MLNESNEIEIKVSKKEIFMANFCYLTRALVKNNVMKQNPYMALLGLEYLVMLYYAWRLADYKTILNVFNPIESFLDVGTNEFGVTINPKDSSNSITLNVQNKAATHVYINCAFCALYMIVVFVFGGQLFKIKSYDNTKETSYLLKSLCAVFLLSITVLQTPIIASCFIVLKIVMLGLVTKLSILAIIILILLIINYSVSVFFALRFINMEVPNEELAWSFNQTGGIYFKVLLKIILCSSELYRDQLNQRAVSITVLLIVVGLISLILLYRINTPNIFNAKVHDFTLFLESSFVALSFIGLVSLVTDRDIFTTLAYLFIFIPVMVKIIFSVDQKRKHSVIYKMKNENALSKNEYLIALTHLLKMIKRQSETDLAQLISFTYQHKLQCYSTSCICQFFTQYCQDPEQFKRKKKRIYRGYKDDGQKLVQLDRPSSLREAMEEQMNLNSLADDQSSVNYLPSNSQGLGESSQIYENQHIMNSDPNLPSVINGIDHLDGVGSASIVLRPAIITQINTEINTRHTLMERDEHLASTRQYMNPLNNQNNNINIQMSMDEINHASPAVDEPMIMSMFQKGNILRGSAYNGFDTNMDFKIKGEFKSPSQFKTVQESRTYFLTRLLETMFKQLEKKTDKNMSFTLISIFFQFAYQHNIYQAVLAMVKHSKGEQRSFLERLQFSVTEFYLLEQILAEFKVTNAKENVNYTTFIESNQMQQNLDWLFEETSNDVLQFWKIFQEEEANIRKAYLLGMSISKNISQIKDFTTKLEEQQMIKDYNKYYYYAMFYQNILNDKQNYNSMINNLKNLLMVRNMRKKNSRFGAGTADINDVGFAILSFEDEKAVGRFKYANRVICQLLNSSEDAIIEKSVKYLMPDLIATNHHHFIKRFLQEGLPRFLGRVRTVFIKDFQGYIKPVQFYVNFHYNSKFSYSLVLHIDPILNFNYQNNQTIPIKHVFATIADAHNNIKDVSYNCKTILGLSRKQLSVQEELMGRCLKVDDIIHQMAKLDQYMLDNPGSMLANSIVKVRSFKNGEQNYITCSLQFEEVTYMKNTANEFKEKVFIFIPVSKIPEFENSSLVGSSEHPYQVQQNVTSKEDFYLQNWASSEFSGTIDQAMQSAEDKFMSASQSCSSQSNSSANSSSSLSYTKGLLFSQRSPKILRIYLYIVFCVLFSFIAVSSINFIIYSQKKNQVDLQIQFNSLINKRNTYLVHSISSLKQLQMISSLNSTTMNNLSKSSIFPTVDRFSYYWNQLNSTSLKLLDLHEDFQSLSQLSPSISYRQNSQQYDKVMLHYLSKNFQIYTNNNSFDYGLSLLVSNIGMITTSDLLKEKIQPNINSLISSFQLLSQDYNHTASSTLRNMYYVFQNGLNQLNYLGQVQETDVQYNALQTSSESKLYINLMSFISIGIITLIGVFTFPLLGKIEERKISVLKFFNLLTLNQISLQIDRCREFQSEFTMLSRDVNQNKDNNSEKEESDYENDSDSDFQEEQTSQNQTIKSSKFLNQTQQQSQSLGFQKEQSKLENKDLDDKQNRLNGNPNAKEERKAGVKKFSLLNYDLVDNGIVDQEDNSVFSQKNEQPQTFNPITLRLNSRDSKSNYNQDSLYDYTLSVSQQPPAQEDLTSPQVKQPYSSSIAHIEQGSEKQRVKFAPEELQKEEQQVHKSRENVLGFQPTRKQKKRKSNKIKDRKNSDAFYTSAFDIQRILGKINMNDRKQQEMKYQRRKDRDEQMNEGKQISKQIVQIRATDQEKDFDELRDKNRRNRLNEVFEIPGAKSRIGGKDIMKIRVDEESKEENQVYQNGKRKFRKGESKINFNASIKLNPLGSNTTNSKKNFKSMASSKWKIAKMHINKGENIHSQSKVDREDISLSDSSKSESPKRHREKSSKKEKDKKSYNMRDLLSFKKSTNRTDMIQDLLDKIALREKLKLALYVLVVIIFLNSNLIASYYIGQKTFEEDSIAIMNLATYYHKENYVGNLLLYTYEEFVQNQTMKGVDGKLIASKFLTSTNENENDYNQIRRSYPVFLTSVKDNMELLESSSICNSVFNDNSTKMENCGEVYNQILSKGLTQTIYTIYTYMQTLQVNFDKNNRTSNYLKEVLTDSRFRDMVDLYNEYIRDILQFMSNQVTSAAIEYFDSLSQNYMIVFTTYIGIAVFLCFFFGFFVFKKLKQQIMTSINILAIIPLEDLDARDRNKIEEFLNQ